MLTRIAIALVVALTVLGGLGVVTATAATASSFAAGRCDHVQAPAGYQEGRDFRCGVLTVPERHADGGSRNLALPVVIVVGDGGSGPPLVMLQGGPGGVSAPTFLPLLLTPAGRNPLLGGRDIIIPEQRGTPLASPSLVCASNNLRTCRTALGAVNDLSAYNSTENAADVDALRRALGHGQIDLFGVSYGSYLAQEVVKNHPGTVRSLVLDSVVSPETSPWRAQARSFNEALNRFGQDCNATPACRSVTDFERDLFTVIDRLDATPASVTVNCDAGPRSGRINGEGVLAGIFSGFYSQGRIAAMPAAVAAGAAGDYAPLAMFLGACATGGGGTFLATGMFESVACAEWPVFARADIGLDDIRTRVARYMEGVAQSFVTSCSVWNVPARYPDATIPVSSDVPTLLLVGRYDPITPDGFASSVGNRLSRSSIFRLPNTGHGVVGTTCARDLMIPFLTTPTAPLTATCAERLK